ncbi:hypothetical protein NDU88_000778 [Pleurodeles waltl]|uniref:Uncharacterized protein n=1 Tax=Pleurodeles waltl TaxID=8319 RepID=A0AAV7S666_PLEWA|nr:hypothetical protein NDU88_000778 [Pleurodeles waltl]
MARAQSCVRLDHSEADEPAEFGSFLFRHTDRLDQPAVIKTQAAAIWWGLSSIDYRIRYETDDSRHRRQGTDKYVKGPKTKTLTPATGRQRYSSEHMPSGGRGR